MDLHARPRLRGALLSKYGLALAAFAVIFATTPARSQSGGASDTEVRLGFSAPFSGPLSLLSEVERGVEIYFKYVNDKKGGVLMKDGKRRKITLFSADDGSQASRALGNAHQFVEGDDVLAVFGTVGYSMAVAMRQYLEEKKVPNVFQYTGASLVSSESATYPWFGPGWVMSFATESAIVAEYLKRTMPNAKVAIFYLDQEGGRDQVKTFERAIEGSGITIVAKAAHQLTSATIDSDIVALYRSGADVFLNDSNAKQATQSIRKVAELGWKVRQIIDSTGNQVESVLRPAGLKNADGLLSIGYFKDPADSNWKDDPEVLFYRDIVRQYGKGADPNDILYFQGVALGDLMVKVLENSLPTRASFLNSVRNMDHIKMFGLMPGITVTTGPNDNYVVESAYLMKFNADAAKWEPIGDLISYEGRTPSIK